jgi:hypothetical protein
MIQPCSLYDSTTFQTPHFPIILMIRVSLTIMITDLGLYGKGLELLSSTGTLVHFKDFFYCLSGLKRENLATL